MIFKDPCEQIGTLKLQKVQICSPVKWAHYNEVKIRAPDQGLGPIPASKNEVLGLIPESKKSCCGTNPSYVRLLVL